MLGLLASMASVSTPKRSVGLVRRPQRTDDYLMAPSDLRSARMAKAAARWVLFVGAVFAVGPLAFLLVGTLHAPDGSRGSTPIISQDPFMGMARAVLAVALCCGYGLLVRRLVSARWAYLCAGLALAWAAYGTGTLPDVLRAAPSDQTLWLLALEGLILGLPVIGFAWLVMPHSHHAPVPEGRHKLGLRDPQPVVTGTLAFVIAIVGACVGVWLIAQNLLKGQTIAAAAVGALIAAMAGHLAAPSAPPWAFVAGVVTVAFSAPVVAIMIERSALDILQGTHTMRVLIPLRPMQLDWMAGALIGTPIGLAWAGSFVDPKLAASGAPRAA